MSVSAENLAYEVKTVKQTKVETFTLGLFGKKAMENRIQLLTTDGWRIINSTQAKDNITMVFEKDIPLEMAHAEFKRHQDERADAITARIFKLIFIIPLVVGFFHFVNNNSSDKQPTQQSVIGRATVVGVNPNIVAVDMGSGQQFNNGEIYEVLNVDGDKYVLRTKDGISKIPKNMVRFVANDGSVIQGKTAESEKPRTARTMDVAFQAFSQVMHESDPTGEVFVKVEKGPIDEQVIVTVHGPWFYEPYEARKELAYKLWKAWVNALGPQKPDEASIVFNNTLGERVGGSGWCGGSCIEVDK